MTRKAQAREAGVSTRSTVRVLRMRVLLELLGRGARPGLLSLNELAGRRFVGARGELGHDPRGGAAGEGRSSGLATLALPVEQAGDGALGREIDRLADGDDQPAEARR